MPAPLSIEDSRYGAKKSWLMHSVAQDFLCPCHLRTRKTANCGHVLMLCQAYCGQIAPVNIEMQRAPPVAEGYVSLFWMSDVKLLKCLIFLFSYWFSSSPFRQCGQMKSRDGKSQGREERRREEKTKKIKRHQRRSNKIKEDQVRRKKIPGARNKGKTKTTTTVFFRWIR